MGERNQHDASVYARAHIADMERTVSRGWRPVGHPSLVRSVPPGSGHADERDRRADKALSALAVTGSAMDAQSPVPADERAVAIHDAIRRA